LSQPVIYMIAGPNGAGKTTTAMRLLPEFLSIHRFANADEIARGLNPLDPAGQAIAAGRIMLELMHDLIEQRESFAFETTGASRSFVRLLKLVARWSAQTLTVLKPVIWEEIKNSAGHIHD
jgi:predicted ABC-type ATPase